MAVSDVTICADALIRLGEQPIASFDDGTDAATICSTVYPTLKAYVLSKHSWRFTIQKKKLTRLAAAPLNQWAYQFTLPAQRLTDGVEAVYNDDAQDAQPITNWEIKGNILFADDEEIWVDYQAPTDEDAWPGYFVEFMTVALMSRIAKAVTDQQNEADHWHLVAWGTPQENSQGGMFAEAKARNSQGSPNAVIEDYTLIDARFS